MRGGLYTDFSAAAPPAPPHPLLYVSLHWSLWEVGWGVGGGLRAHTFASVLFDNGTSTLNMFHVF